MKIKKAKITDERWPDGSGKVTNSKVTSGRVGGGTTNEEIKPSI